MKVLLAVVNCHAREEFSAAISSTWLPFVPKEMDVIFFRGRGATRAPKENEVFLDCGDAYHELPEKIQAIFKWAFEHGYDFCAKVDDDVVVLPAQWLASGFEKYDFTGGQEPACKSNEIKTPFGFFYILSRRAMELVAYAPLPGQYGSTHPNGTGNDEAWVSTILYINHIFLHGDLRYFLHRGSPIYRKRALRPPRAPRRDYPPERTVEPGTFAWCMYLNQGGWHTTPDDEIIKEFKRIWETVKPTQ